MAHGSGNRKNSRRNVKFVKKSKTQEAAMKASKEKTAVSNPPTTEDPLPEQPKIRWKAVMLGPVPEGVQPPYNSFNPLNIVDHKGDPLKEGTPPPQTADDILAEADNILAQFTEDLESGDSDDDDLDSGDEVAIGNHELKSPVRTLAQAPAPAAPLTLSTPPTRAHQPTPSPTSPIGMGEFFRNSFTYDDVLAQAPEHGNYSHLLGSNYPMSSLEHNHLVEPYPMIPSIGSFRDADIDPMLFETPPLPTPPVQERMVEQMNTMVQQPQKQVPSALVSIPTHMPSPLTGSLAAVSAIPAKNAPIAPMVRPSARNSKPTAVLDYEAVIQKKAEKAKEKKIEEERERAERGTQSTETIHLTDAPDTSEINLMATDRDNHKDKDVAEAPPAMNFLDMVLNSTVNFGVDYSTNSDINPVNTAIPYTGSVHLAMMQEHAHAMDANPGNSADIINAKAHTLPDLPASITARPTIASQTGFTGNPSTPRIRGQSPLLMTLTSTARGGEDTVMGLFEKVDTDQRDDVDKEAGISEKSDGERDRENFATKPAAAMEPPQVGPSSTPTDKLQESQTSDDAVAKQRSQQPANNHLFVSSNNLNVPDQQSRASSPLSDLTELSHIVSPRAPTPEAFPTNNHQDTSTNEAKIILPVPKAEPQSEDMDIDPSSFSNNSQSEEQSSSSQQSPPESSSQLSISGTRGRRKASIASQISSTEAPARNTRKRKAQPQSPAAPTIASTRPTRGAAVKAKEGIHKTVDRETPEEEDAEEIVEPISSQVLQSPATKKRRVRRSTSSAPSACSATDSAPSAPAHEGTSAAAAKLAPKEDIATATGSRKRNTRRNAAPALPLTTTRRATRSGANVTESEPVTSGSNFSGAILTPAPLADMETKNTNVQKEPSSVSHTTETNPVQTTITSPIEPSQQFSIPDAPPHQGQVAISKSAFISQEPLGLGLSFIPLPQPQPLMQGGDDHDVQTVSAEPIVQDSIEMVEQVAPVVSSETGPPVNPVTPVLGSQQESHELQKDAVISPVRNVEIRRHPSVSKAESPTRQLLQEAVGISASDAENTNEAVVDNEDDVLLQEVDNNIPAEIAEMDKSVDQTISASSIMELDMDDEHAEPLQQVEPIAPATISSPTYGLPPPNQLTPNLTTERLSEEITESDYSQPLPTMAGINVAAPELNATVADNNDQVGLQAEHELEHQLEDESEDEPEDGPENDNECDPVNEPMIPQNGNNKKANSKKAKGKKAVVKKAVVKKAGNKKADDDVFKAAKALMYFQTVKFVDSEQPPTYPKPKSGKNEDFWCMICGLTYTEIWQEKQYRGEQLIGDRNKIFYQHIESCVKDVDWGPDPNSFGPDVTPMTAVDDVMSVLDEIAEPENVIHHRFYEDTGLDFPYYANRPEEPGKMPPLISLSEFQEMLDTPNLTDAQRLAIESALAYTILEAQKEHFFLGRVELKKRRSTIEFPSWGKAKKQKKVHRPFELADDASWEAANETDLYNIDNQSSSGRRGGLRNRNADVQIPIAWGYSEECSESHPAHNFNRAAPAPARTVPPVTRAPRTAPASARHSPEPAPSTSHRTASAVQPPIPAPGIPISVAVPPSDIPAATPPAPFKRGPGRPRKDGTAPGSARIPVPTTSTRGGGPGSRGGKRAGGPGSRGGKASPQSGAPVTTKTDVATPTGTPVSTTPVSTPLITRTPIPPPNVPNMFKAKLAAPLSAAPTAPTAPTAPEIAPPAPVHRSHIPVPVHIPQIPIATPIPATTPAQTTSDASHITALKFSATEVLDRAKAVKAVPTAKESAKAAEGPQAVGGTLLSGVVARGAPIRRRGRPKKVKVDSPAITPALLAPAPPTAGVIPAPGSIPVGLGSGQIAAAGMASMQGMAGYVPTLPPHLIPPHIIQYGQPVQLPLQQQYHPQMIQHTQQGQPQGIQNIQNTPLHSLTPHQQQTLIAHQMAQLQQQQVLPQGLPQFLPQQMQQAQLPSHVQQVQIMQHQQANQPMLQQQILVAQQLQQQLVPQHLQNSVVQPGYYAPPPPPPHMAATPTSVPPHQPPMSTGTNNPLPSTPGFHTPTPGPSTPVPTSQYASNPPSSASPGSKHGRGKTYKTPISIDVQEAVGTPRPTMEEQFLAAATSSNLGKRQRKKRVEMLDDSGDDSGDDKKGKGRAGKKRRTE